MNLIRTKSYFGQPFIFNDLSNFGGKSALFGHLDKVNKGSKLCSNITIKYLSRIWNAVFRRHLNMLKCILQSVELDSNESEA